MLPWWAIAGFIWVVFVGVLMGVLAASKHAEFLDRLEPSRARRPGRK